MNNNIININYYSNYINQVYDGWSTDGLVLNDGNTTNIAYKEEDEAVYEVIYSVTNKMMIHFQPPKIKENHVFYLETFTVFKKLNNRIHL
jgi:hypothetical protein